MYGGGVGWARKAFKSVTRATRGKTYGRRGSTGQYEPERIIDVDLAPRSSRTARIREANRRRAAALPIWFAVIAVALGSIVVVMFATKG